jgi:hypothetical protein
MDGSLNAEGLAEKVRRVSINSPWLQRFLFETDDYHFDCPVSIPIPYSSLKMLLHLACTLLLMV